MRFCDFNVKHDHGLAFIYAGALGGWVYLIANGLTSLPAPPIRLWLILSPELGRVISVGFAALVSVTA